MIGRLGYMFDGSGKYVRIGSHYIRLIDRDSNKPFRYSDEAKKALEGLTFVGEDVKIEHGRKFGFDIKPSKTDPVQPTIEETEKAQIDHMIHQQLLHAPSTRKELLEQAEKYATPEDAIKHLLLGRLHEARKTGDSSRFDDLRKWLQNAYDELNKLKLLKDQFWAYSSGRRERELASLALLEGKQLKEISRALGARYDHVPSTPSIWSKSFRSLSRKLPLPKSLSPRRGGSTRSSWVHVLNSRLIQSQAGRPALANDSATKGAK